LDNKDNSADMDTKAGTSETEDSIARGNADGAIDRDSLNRLVVQNTQLAANQKVLMKHVTEMSLDLKDLKSVIYDLNTELSKVLGMASTANEGFRKASANSATSSEKSAVTKAAMSGIVASHLRLLYYRYCADTNINEIYGLSDGLLAILVSSIFLSTKSKVSIRMSCK
jgi:hypothetical protein